ncbi:ABC transporter permease [Fictibacillus arsenicus]|uniref:ABC transporter permease n=1 Tax=Fictibacillus arsenicus TaxID=255247 RepID=A0A1B1Z912_9BACL|nr:ABC transporter permease [Fictibacillus arsenicus]ANX13933.1 ABC transporter permease [Fictibacillus arsenicus]
MIPKLKELNSDIQAQKRQKVIIKNKVAFLDKNISNVYAPLGVITILVVWQIVSMSGLVNEFTLPSPSTILLTAWELIKDGSLWTEISASLYRLGWGYFFGCIAGIAIGIILGFSKLSEKVGMPIVNTLYPIPKIAILPLIMLWLGIGEVSKITVIAIGVFFPVVYNTYTGVTQTQRLLINVAVTFGASRMDLVKKVILPSSFPMMLSGMRIAAGTALLILVSAEMVAAEHGIGAFILQNADLLIISKVMVGVFILCILGLLFNQGLAWLEKKLIPWR